MNVDRISSIVGIAGFVFTLVVFWDKHGPAKAVKLSLTTALIVVLGFIALSGQTVQRPSSETRNQPSPDGRPRQVATQSSGEAASDGDGPEGRPAVPTEAETPTEPSPSSVAVLPQTALLLR